MAELTALGTVTTMRMEQWAIRSQVLSREQLGLCHDTDAVHRLNGGGWREIAPVSLCLRYSQALVRASRIYKIGVYSYERGSLIEACGETGFAVSGTWSVVLVIMSESTMFLCTFGHA